MVTDRIREWQQQLASTFELTDGPIGKRTVRLTDRLGQALTPQRGRAAFGQDDAMRGETPRRPGAEPSTTG